MMSRGDISRTPSLRIDLSLLSGGPFSLTEGMRVCVCVSLHLCGWWGGGGGEGGCTWEGEMESMEGRVFRYVMMALRARSGTANLFRPKILPD
jgi:hypothetical protein